MATRRIGEMLVAEGLLTEAAVQRALGYQRLSGERMRLGTILLGWDLLPEDSLLAALSTFHRCPAVSWAMLASTPNEVVRLLPGPHAIRLDAIPYGAEKGVVRVAFVNPSNLGAIDEVAALTGRRVLPGVTTEARLLQAHQKFLGKPVPLPYRQFLQKLDRRTDSGATQAQKDFRTSDVVEAERPAAAGSARSSDLDPPYVGRIPIAVAGPPAARRTVQPVPLASSVELPDFPEIPASAGRSTADRASPAGKADPASSKSGEDSLDWFDRAISGFAGGEPSPEPDSPAGIPDPALFGRARDSNAPGAIAFRDQELPATNALRAQTGERLRRPEPDRPLTAAHALGIPGSIPPFRRASDPIHPEAHAASALDREDEAVALMWRPPPEKSTQPPALWSEAPPDSSEGPLARSRDEIADLVLEGSLAALPRVLLLGAGKTGVTGWRGRGEGLSEERVGAIHIPASEPSVFSFIQKSGVPQFGAIEESEWPQGLAVLFGSPPPDCAIFPIRILDSVAGFLYADRLGLPMRYDDFALVARSAASAANILSGFLLRGDRSGFSVPS